MYKGIVVLAAALVSGLTVAAEAPARELVAVGSPPPGCQSLGEVAGSHYHETPNMDLAKESAFRQAKAAGATHIQIVEDKSGYVAGPYEVTYTVITYRCPVPAASPGK